jgi:hypothetical protein
MSEATTLHKKWVDKQNTRYGLRGFGEASGFTATVAITLAPGIGTSSAIFSIVDSVLLRRLPYHTADGIVAIQELNTGGTNPGTVGKLSRLALAVDSL